jgi:membrane-bound lytic murein transglycosylase D
MDFVMHKVKAGETLSAIARQYGMTVQELKSLNNLRSDRINIDQKLQVKAPAVKQKPQKESHKIETKVVQNQDLSNKRKLIHEVMQGETLYSISKQYPGVSYEEIKVWNNLNDLIYPGQKIVIFVNK